MLCAIAKMAVLGAFGTEKVIFPYRIVGLVHFYLFPLWLLVKWSIFAKIRLSGPEKVNLQKIKKFSG